MPNRRLQCWKTMINAATEKTLHFDHTLNQLVEEDWWCIELQICCNRCHGFQDLVTMIIIHNLSILGGILLLSLLKVSRVMI